MNEFTKRYRYLQTDVFFKYLLTYDEKHAQHFLKRIITEVTSHVPEKITIINPDIIRSYRNEREIILDVYVVTREGRHIGIEMQMSQLTHYQRDRFEYYLAKLHSRQIKKGEGYDKIQETYVIIFINDFHHVDQKIFQSDFILKDEKNYPYEGRMHLHMIYMPSLRLGGKDYSHLNTTETIAYLFQTNREDDILNLEGDDASMIKDSYVTFENDDELVELSIEIRKYFEELERRDREKEMREKGYQEGEKAFQKKMNTLIAHLLEEKRYDDLARSTVDPAYQEALFKEYHLE